MVHESEAGKARGRTSPPPNFGCHCFKSIDRGQDAFVCGSRRPSGGPAGIALDFFRSRASGLGRGYGVKGTDDRETLPLIKRSDWINVKTDIAPAAVGDGVADDTAALKAAFAQMGDQKVEKAKGVGSIF